MKTNFKTKAICLTLCLLCLMFSFPLSAFATAEPIVYSIIDDANGVAISVDPRIEKAESLPEAIAASFEDRALPLGRSGRALTYVNKGTFGTDENYDFYISPPSEASGQTVTWSSSNTNFATVDSQGLVYTKGPGTCTIYADAGNTRYTYRLVIQIENKVCKIQNTSNNYYIELPNGNIAEGTKYIQWGAENNRNQKFKITRVGVGQYTIRSMVASNMGLARSSEGYLVNINIGTSSNPASIPSNAIWNLSSIPNNSGWWNYNFYNIDEDEEMCSIYSVSGDEGQNYRVVDSYGSSSYYYRFVNVAPEHGVEIRNSTDHLALGDTFDFKATMYSSYHDANGQNGIRWYVTNGTGSATISSTGRLTPVSAGTVTVKAEYVYNSNITWNSSYSVYIVEIDDETYHITNTSTLKNIRQDESGTSVAEQHAFEYGSLYQNWTITYAGNGYHYIVNQNNGLYLTASANATDGSTVNCLERNTSIDSRQLWKITRTGGHTTGVSLPTYFYNIQSKSCENANLFLAIHDNATGSGATIVLRNKANAANKKACEWILQRYNSNVKIYAYIGILYDNQLQMSISSMESILSNATYKYRTIFGINIVLAYIEHNSGLDRPTSCVGYSSGSICGESCGSNCETDHHTNVERLLNIGLGSPYCTIRLVGYDICAYDDYDDAHIGPRGAAYMGERESIVSTTASSSVERTTQHELGHNLGLEDCANSACVMKSGGSAINTWCSNCSSQLSAAVGN